MRSRLLPTLLALLLFSSGFTTPVTAQNLQCGDDMAAETPPPPVGPGEWWSLPDMPRPRSEMAATVVDGWIYVVGGFGGSAQVECLFPLTGMWLMGPDLPQGVHHPGVTSHDGIIYVAGGYTDEHPSTDALWAFDPEAGEWEARAPMPTSRGALGLVAVDGLIYAIGGAEDHLGGAVTGIVEIYNPKTDTWTTGAEMPTPREHLAVVAVEGMIYAIGGRANGDEGDRFASANELYDPATDSWTTLPALPTPRGGFNGVYVSGHVVVMGGERDMMTYDAVDAYNVVTGEWVSLAPMPTARHGVATAVIGETVYAIAGSTLGGRIDNTGATEAIMLPEEAFK